MQSYIFIDIDGTLLHHGDIIPDSAIMAIKQARKKGHRVYLSTGRPKGEVSSEVTAIGFDGGVYAGGAYVEANNEVLYENPIDQNEMEDMMRWMDKHTIGYAIQTANQTYLNDIALQNIHAVFGIEKSSELDKMKKLMELFLPIRKYEHTTPILKFCFYAWYEEAKALIKERMHRYELIFHNSDTLAIYGEVTNSGIVKSLGVKKILAYEHGDISQSIAYGDSNNDVEMLRFVALGICMENGVDELKAIADEVCGHVEEDGLYLSFQQHGLI